VLPETPRIIPARIDLNAASKEQLAGLEAVDFEIADKVIAGRPYKSAEEVIERMILTKTDYDKIKNRVGIGPSKEIRVISGSKVRKIMDEGR
jgi:DNA uptake protein ComE-like DNA-binding protein